jgi:hypothetical protein
VFCSAWVVGSRERVMIEDGISICLTEMAALADEAVAERRAEAFARRAGGESHLT